MAALMASVRNRHGVQIIDLAGPVTIGEPASQLRQTILREAADNSRLVLNMAHVSLMDSAGLGELLDCCLGTLSGRGPMKLACLQPRVAELMQMTRASDLFDIYESEDAAVQSFGVNAGA